MVEQQHAWHAVVRSLLFVSCKIAWQHLGFVHNNSCDLMLRALPLQALAALRLSFTTAFCRRLGLHSQMSRATTLAQGLPLQSHPATFLPPAHCQT